MSFVVLPFTSVAQVAFSQAVWSVSEWWVLAQSALLVPLARLVAPPFFLLVFLFLALEQQPVLILQAQWARLSACCQKAGQGVVQQTKAALIQQNWVRLRAALALDRQAQF